MAFSSKHATSDNIIGLEPMIFYLSQGKKFIDFPVGRNAWKEKNQFKRISTILEEYIDQITPYFGEDFKQFEDTLLSMQKEYNNLLLEKNTLRI